MNWIESKKELERSWEVTASELKRYLEESGNNLETNSQKFEINKKGTGKKVV